MAEYAAPPSPPAHRKRTGGATRPKHYPEPAEPGVRPAHLFADSPAAEAIRDELLRRLDEHFARPEVVERTLKTLGVARAVYTQLVQRVAERLFPESFDLDYDAARRGVRLRGIVPRGGFERCGQPDVIALAAYLTLTHQPTA